MSDSIITIDTAEKSSIAAAISAGVTTPELMAEVIDGAELVNDCLLLYPGTWHAADMGSEEEIEAECGRDAATEFVDGGDWGSDEKTTWVSVRVWREGIDSDGDIVRVGEEDHDITIEPKEPECTESEHDWQTPHAIVGGIKENPGVWGSGGGVVMTSVCMHCGCERTIDTWAQNPENGRQGLRSVAYEAGKYADEVRELSAND